MSREPRPRTCRDARKSLVRKQWELQKPVGQRHAAGSRPSRSPFRQPEGDSPARPAPLPVRKTCHGVTASRPLKLVRKPAPPNRAWRRRRCPAGAPIRGHPAGLALRMRSNASLKKKLPEDNPSDVPCREGDATTRTIQAHAATTTTMAAMTHTHTHASGLWPWP